MSATIHRKLARSNTPGEFTIYGLLRLVSCSSLIALDKELSELLLCSIEAGLN